MFTGIIRHLGTVEAVSPEPDNYSLVITSPLAHGLHEGDSVAVNGVCLTVLERTATAWKARLMQETLQKTNLGRLAVGSTVNLEQPLHAQERIDGHFVLGHVDGVCEVHVIVQQNDDKIFTFSLPSVLAGYLIPKGSVALDGVSLTVVEVTPDAFTVSLMPYTLAHTTFGTATVGYTANIEVDVLGKYVARLLEHQRATIAV